MDLPFYIYFQHCHLASSRISFSKFSSRIPKVGTDCDDTIPITLSELIGRSGGSFWMPGWDYWQLAHIS